MLSNPFYRQTTMESRPPSMCRKSRHDTSRQAAPRAGLWPASAVALTGMTGAAAQLTVQAMLRNLTIAQRLGCLGPAGLHDMRRGQSPTITLGPYAGDQLSVDHIIPFSVAPQLDKCIANLELMPLRMNIRSRAAAVAARPPKYCEDSQRQIMRMHDPKGDMSVRREGVNKDTMGERQHDALTLAINPSQALLNRGD